MRTLRDAKDWYDSALRNLVRMRRLGSHHWNDKRLEETTIFTDDRFKRLESPVIVSETSKAIEPLNDLGVLVLFSVFEANVRDHLESVIKPLTSRLSHPILVDAGAKALEGIRQGSFANNVLSPLQEQQRITPQLSDRVKQVRDYRNWIAHGRREPRPAHIINLTVAETFDRLKEFLDTLGIAVEPEL